MSLRVMTLWGAAALLAASTVGMAAAPVTPPDSVPQQARMFGRGAPFGIGDLPDSALRRGLQLLPPQARARALDWLHGIDFPAADVHALRVDPEGGIFVLDDFPPPDDGAEGTAGETSAVPIAAVDNPFGLHSKPGAWNTVYLDFNGQVLTGRVWNSNAGVDPLVARPFDLDGNPSGFSAAEAAAIAEIWHRVAEDYAAFDIDVTTEEPAKFGPNVGHVLITAKTDANGKAMPYNSYGGYAYINVFGSSSYTYYSPALVYYENLSKATTYIAECAAHELGHNLGLTHDGTTAGATYYQGHGSGYTSWAPIMGSSYYTNVTQWSKGEYTGANNGQDDIAIVAGKLGTVADVHGDTPATATPILIEANGEVPVSNPELDPDDLYPANKGVIGKRGDKDVFSLRVDAGPLNLVVNPAWDAFYRTSKRGANLDLRAALLDAKGAKIAESDPSTDTYAAVSATVPAGTYYLEVSGVGSGNYSDYASQGQYFIAGQVTPSTATNQVPSAAFGYGCSGLACSFTDGSSDSDGVIASRVWDFGDGSSSSGASASHTYAAGGTYKVTLTVTDDAGASGSTSQGVSVTAPANSSPTANFAVSCMDLGCTFTDQSSDGDGSIKSWAWDFGDGTSSTAQHPKRTYAAAGTYTVKLVVTDNASAKDDATKTATTKQPAATFSMTATGYKVKGQQKADLKWSGTSAASIDVFRNGAKITTVANTAAYTDPINAKGGGSYRFRVCEAGTTTCSNEVLVSF